MPTRRIVLWLALVTILFACSDTPKPANAIWDQSNYDSTSPT
jgi:hypothetical protein